MHPDLIFLSFGIKFDIDRARNSRKPGPAGCAQRLNPPPLGRRLEPHSHLSVPGRVSLPYPPAGRAHSVGRPSPSASRRHPHSFFNPCFFVRISVGHVDGPTNHFFEKFLDFWWSRRRFSTILGPKTGPRGSLFRCFFKNDDFVEIVLPLWWEHSFQGLDLPKIDLEIDCERQRRTTSKKIASDAVSERTFSVPGSFLVDFGVQLGSQDGLFGPTFGRLS